MEVFIPPKHLSKRLVLLLYCCLSFIFFCAFYQYSVSHSGLSKPYNLQKSKRLVTTMGYSDILPPHNWTTSLSHDHDSVADPETTRDDIPDQQRNRLVNSSKRVKLKEDSKSAVQHSMDMPLQSPSSRKFANSAPVQETSVQYSTVVFPPTTERDDTNDTLSESSCKSLNTKKSKLILLWTSFFGSWNYLPTGPFSHCASCTNCYSTTNRSRLLESDAVIFHVRDMFLADLPLKRLPNQRWIFYCLESPPYSDFPGLQFMNRMFNWTMTYRTDSDIVTQYGRVEKVHPPKKIDRDSLRIAWELKTKSVVWMSSHCPTHGGRDAYVNELKKYIDVDEYGTCGTIDCPKDSTKQCLQQFADNYKFFLAFENTICSDYITEKFFRTLKYDIVPVVFGGARYQNFAPPGSYVDALAFKSPKHLAYFLTGVGKDFSLYSSYFEWRKEYSVRMDNNKECSLCSLLHQGNPKPSVYKDMREWWVDKGHCRSWEPKPLQP